MSETISIYNLDSIVETRKKKFELVQTRIDITGGDGISILPTLDGYEIQRTFEMGKQIVKRTFENQNTIQPIGDTTITAISLNQNTDNKFTMELVIRDDVNNTVSWTNAVFYISYFTTISQVGTTIISTNGTPVLNVNLMLDNFQVIIFVNGNGTTLRFKSSILVETAQF